VLFVTDPYGRILTFLDRTMKTSVTITDSPEYAAGATHRLPNQPVLRLVQSSWQLGYGQGEREVTAPYFPLLHTVQNSSGAKPASVSGGIRRKGREADLVAPSIAEVKNGEAIPPLLHVFMEWSHWTV
jgi:hypothetical protein